MVHDHARAEDIAREVFISALRRLRDTERPIAFKPWLYEIAKDACIDEFRRAQRAREVPLEADHDDGEGSSGPLIAGGTTPDREVENKQRLVTKRATNAVSNVSQTASNVTNTATNTVNNALPNAGGLIPGH